MVPPILATANDLGCRRDSRWRAASDIFISNGEASCQSNAKYLSMHTSFGMSWIMDKVLKRLQWKHLRLIHEIGVTGQISLAADRLNMTQPSASRSLAEVEKAIGSPLFYRRPNGLTATPLGEVVLRRTPSLLQNLDDTVFEIDAFVKGRKGTVKVGAVTGAALAYVVPAAKQLNAQTEFANIHIEVGTSDALTRGLRNGEYDFVLSRLPTDSDAQSLKFQGGRVEKVELLVHKTHPLVGKKTVSIEELVDFGWVIQAPGSPVREAMERAFAASGIRFPPQIVNTSSLLVTIAYLENTDHIAPVSSEIVSIIADPNHKNFSRLNLDQNVVVYPYHLIQDEARTLSPIAQHLRDLISEAMAVS